MSIGQRPPHISEFKSQGHPVINATTNLRKRAPWYDARRGAAIVEMAIAAPVLILILLGLIQFGYVFMVQHLLQNAAREGCRNAILPASTNSSVTSGVAAMLQSQRINGATTTLMVNGGAGSISKANSGDNIVVQITLPVANVSIVPNTYLKGTLTASCVRRLE